MNGLRLSRISHPRATLGTAILLTTAFLIFGLFANPKAQDTPFPPVADCQVCEITTHVLARKTTHLE